MKVIVCKSYITFRRDRGESRVRNESELLHRLKRILAARGYDLIKKLMWKDGHLVSDTQHYLRARNKVTRGGMVCIHDADYAIRNSAQYYNQWRRVTFQVECV